MVPVARNIPCDIDEMIDVVTADDGIHAPFDNGNFGFGQFEAGRRRSDDSVIRLANSSENFRAASRRSTDPGRIEFSTVALPSTLPSYHPESLSMTRSPLRFCFDEEHGDGGVTNGATILRCFEAIQGLKRRKTVQAQSCVTSYEVSVKVNSSSSRSSIFVTSPDKQKVDNDCTPIVLEATLPIEVENGRKMSKTRAETESENLGSYDLRNGLPPLQSGNNSIRLSVGRTRLVWARKVLSDQRVSYTSLVTGQRLDNAAVKRPRNVQVRIRVDGDIFQSPNTASNWEMNAEINLQASLQCDQLVRNLLDGKSDKTKSPYFVPPLIECIPDSAGSIHVVCTSPGAILQSSISPILKLAGENSKPRCSVCWRSTEGGLEVRECAKCGLLAHIECCLDPGKLWVVSETNNKSGNEEWTCSVCCHNGKNEAKNTGARTTPQKLQAIKKSKRITRPSSKLKDHHFESVKAQNIDHSTVVKNKEIECSICGLSGGAMSRIPVENENFWVHETCRIWTDAQRHSPDSKNLSCVLCGSGFNGTLPADSRLRRGQPTQRASARSYSSHCVVKCAAPGCHLSVHPMCALASTLTSQSMIEASNKNSKDATLNDILKAKKRDEELCCQYTLTFASIYGLAHSFGKDPGARCSTPLPIIFCGIHNPAREQSCHGLYPGGRLMDLDKTLNIPSC